VRTTTRPATVLAVACAVAFGVLSLLVATGATRAPDSAVLARLRPGDVWGDTQVRWSPWMHRLDPARMFGLLALTAAVVALRHRSWRPVVIGVVVGAATVGLTVGAKLLLGRTDPHGYLTATGGSFPSGHMASAVAALAGCVLVVWPHGRWWRWVPVAAGATLLGVAQLVSAAHWPTDLLGGALLALVVVGAVCGLGLHRPRTRQPVVAAGAAGEPGDAAGLGTSPDRRNRSRVGATTSAS